MKLPRASSIVAELRDQGGSAPPMAQHDREALAVRILDGCALSATDRLYLAGMLVLAGRALPGWEDEAAADRRLELGITALAAHAHFAKEEAGVSAARTAAVKAWGAEPSVRQVRKAVAELKALAAQSPEVQAILEEIRRLAK